VPRLREGIGILRGEQAEFGIVRRVETWLTFAVLFGAALTQGYLGFGFGILAMGALTLTGDLVYAAGLVNLTACASTACMSFLLRRNVRWRRVLRILPWTVVGIGAGLLTLDTLSRAVLVRLLGLTIVVVALWNLRARPLQRPPSGAADALAGLGAGLLGGAFNIPGPPLIAHLYRLRHPPEALKGTVQTLFLLMCLIRASGGVYRGQITVEIGVQALLALPAVLGGLTLGILVGRRVSSEHFRRTSWIAFAVLGLYLAVVG
jgi:uncharacterized membrane protein YfcA